MGQVQLFIGAPVFDISAAGLVIPGVGRGAYLLIDAHAGNPNLDIVGSRHREGAVACRQLTQAVVEAKLLDQPLCLADQLLKGGVRLILGGILNHFHLIELVAPDHAPFFRTVAAGLSPVAGGVSDIFSRQVFLA